MGEAERPLRLLSLDGGGIRGLSSLYILKQIMVTAQSKEAEKSPPAPPRPCEYFDLIAGTSTGGLIAVMLGVLRMDVDTCIETYSSLARDIFPLEGWLSGSKLGRLKKAATGKQRFSPAPFEAAVKRLIAESTGEEETSMMSESPHTQSSHKCKVFVCVTSEKSRGHFRFRSYESPWNQLDDVAIWQACRATSAAPTYFPPAIIGNPPVAYVDGALGYNNPIRALMDEVRHLWPNHGVDCIISIGTGVPAPRDVGRSIKPLLETLKAISTDTEKVAREVKDEIVYSHPGRYFRFNVQRGLEGVGLEEWKEMDRVKTVTVDYLQENWEQVDLCASRLLNTDDTKQANPVRKPASALSTVRIAQDKKFVGREDILTQLRSILENDTGHLRATLYGLGGIGKSQIAIEYAYRIRQRDPLMSTFWIHSSSRARFEQSFGEIADQIRTDACEVGSSDTLQTVSRWLSDKKNGPWLLILDNADDARVLLDLQQDHTARDAAPIKRRLIDYIPQVPHGIVLVTTRDRTSGWALTGDYSTPIEVQSMGPVESLELLKGKLPVESGSEAVELLKELEYVPLAISQAGAYIRERAPLMTIQKYLAEFRKSQDNQTTLLNANHADLRRDGEVPNAVITSWQLSFDHIRPAYPKTADLLSLMSIFNRQAIPQFLVQGEYDDLAFCEVMGPLLNFSLVRAESTGQMFELHRLVQIATRHWLARDSSNQHWIDCAIDRMIELFPLNKHQNQNWASCEMLFPHIEEVLGNEPESEKYRLTYAALLTRSSHYLIERKADYLLAEERSKKALDIQRKILAPGDGDLLATLSAIAYAYSRQERYQEAEELQVEILEQWKEKGVETDECTLIAMSNLAQTYTKLHNFEEAEELFSRVHGLQSRLLGLEHPDNMFTDISLADLNNEKGDFQTAETLSFSALERATTLFGSDHLVAFSASRTLFNAYMGQKKYVEAEKLGLEDLSIRRRIFGASHEHTLISAHCLALVYLEEGKLVEAERQCRECLDLSMEVLGQRNRDTLGTTHLLAQIHREQGRLKEAEDICRTCLDLKRETLGPQERSTLGAESLLGVILMEQDNFLAASELLANCANVSREVYGAEHEDTLHHLHEYAVCVERLGKKQEAIRLMTEVFDGGTKLFGADHPHTVYSAEWLAYWKAAEGGEDA